jgi:hypothetical protein
MGRNALLTGLACVALACSRKEDPLPQTQAASQPIQSTCRRPNDVSAHFLGVILETVADEGLRARFHLPAVKPAEVHLISDPGVCAEAGRALDSLARTWVPTKPPPTEASYGPLLVFRIGSSYAVVDPNSSNDSDCDILLFFSSGWKYSGVGCSQ